jgi:transposase
LKGDLQIRPIYHQKEDRIEAHIFVAYLAYCLHLRASPQFLSARVSATGARANA